MSETSRTHTATLRQGRRQRAALDFNAELGAVEAVALGVVGPCSADRSVAAERDASHWAVDEGVAESARARAARWCAGVVAVAPRAARGLRRVLPRMGGVAWPFTDEAAVWLLCSRQGPSASQGAFPARTVQQHCL